MVIAAGAGGLTLRNTITQSFCTTLQADRAEAIGDAAGAHTQAILARQRARVLELAADERLRAALETTEHTLLTAAVDAGQCQSLIYRMRNTQVNRD